MPKWLILCFIHGIFLSLVGCLPKNELPGTRERTPTRPIPTTPPPASGTTTGRPGTSAAGYKYIERFKDIAIEEMHRHGIPASIKLAQGILESGNGNSQLARRANNHFGIKCTSDWVGGRTYHDDDQENDCFRVYAHPEESFRDHSQFLMRRRYERLFQLDPRDYRAWARGLKDAGYATNPRYADLLIDLIERYELYQYDDPASQGRSRALVQQPPRQVQEQPKKAAEPAVPEKNVVTMVIHEVVPGETLAQIAGRYGLTVEETRSMNGMRGHEVHPGQLLIVSKR